MASLFGVWTEFIVFGIITQNRPAEGGANIGNAGPIRAHFT